MKLLFHGDTMKITHLSIDFLKIIGLILVVVLASLGTISWWIVILFVILGMELKIRIEI